MVLKRLFSFFRDRFKFEKFEDENPDELAEELCSELTEEEYDYEYMYFMH